MPSGPPEFRDPPFIAVTGLKCSYGKISSPTEISGTEPPALSYEHIENFSKDLDAKRDLGQSRKPGPYEEGPLIFFFGVFWVII